MDELFIDYLMIRLRTLLLDIIGVEIYYMPPEADLRAKESFDAGSEELLRESIFDCFFIDIDLANQVPLTLEKIADYINQEIFLDSKGGGFTTEEIEKKNLVLDETSFNGLLSYFDRLISETNSGPVGRRCSI